MGERRPCAWDVLVEVWLVGCQTVRGERMRGRARLVWVVIGVAWRDPIAMSITPGLDEGGMQASCQPECLFLGKRETVIRVLIRVLCYGGAVRGHPVSRRVARHQRRPMGCCAEPDLGGSWSREHTKAKAALAA